ncbi:MAG TPA: EF-hand domain-containing protein, partial [Polyangiales bacterium]|nr:EF-hand domain-containing protein [Polyangiales bacterium]
FATPEEFVAQAQKVMDAPIDAKIGFLFRLHDADGDGWIHRDELDRLLHIAVAEHDLKLSEREIDELVTGVIAVGDRDADGRISLIEFVQMMIAHPPIQQQLADYGVSLLMPGKRARLRMRIGAGISWQGWVRNEAVLAIWITAYIALNAWVFGEAFMRYGAAGANLYLQIARGSGACLNLNCALIALPMLRHGLAWVRRSFLGSVVPVDDAVVLHALIGEVTLLFALVHSVAHGLNQWPAWQAGTGMLTAASATGGLLLLALLVIWVFSRGFVRRSGRFELFYVTHLAYLAVVVLLFVHGPVFWMWGTLPWLWYLVERVQRMLRRRSRASIAGVQVLTSNVTRIDFERPRDFEYSPGDYVFLCLPSLARHEWHPFTLTSAPEDPERLTVHVRSVGNWTGIVRERLPAAFSAGEAAFARIDGPYGTASRHILDAPHAVAIAGGIGVTPFASILQSLLLRAESSDERPTLRKLRFVWLNRDQYSFEWFRDLLVELERRDHQRLLDVHTFMTAGRADMAGGVFELARLVRRRRGGDLLTGLQAQTGLGAPDFDRLLESFCRAPDLPHPEVYFCGPLALERVVEQTCRRLGLRMRSERF